MPPVLRSAARNLHPRPCRMRLDANFHCHFPRNSQQQGPPLKMRTELLHPTNLICPLLRPHLVSWMWQFCDPVGEENGIPHMTMFRNQNRAALHIKSLPLSPSLSLSLPLEFSSMLKLDFASSILAVPFIALSRTSYHAHRYTHSLSGSRGVDPPFHLLEC
jgi:hypothetical protein